ncbi:MAG: hypothetical protein ACRDJI_01790, partial [Actinomycetota bacterium]
PQDKVINRAAEQATQATSIWQLAITELDTALADVGLGPSQITVPGTTPPPLPSPAPSPEATVETGGDGKGEDNGEDKGKDESGDDKGSEEEDE